MQEISEKFAKLQERLQKLAPKHDPSLDASCEIIFNEDKTCTYLVLHPPKLSGRKLTLEDIKEKLKEYNIVSLDEHAIIWALSKNRYNEKIIIAEGRAPTKGEDAKILYLYDKSGMKVNCGQVIAVIEPPKLGEDGICVTGEVIPGEWGQMPPWKISKALGFNGRLLYSKQSGKLFWDADKIDVVGAEEIFGDLDRGTYSFDKAVQVHGKIKPNVSVIAKSDVHIFGDVESAKIDVLGDLVVWGDIVDSRIVCRGNLTSQAIRKTKAVVSGILKFSNDLVSSDIFAQIIVGTGGFPVIVSSKIRVKEGIDVASITGKKSPTYIHIERGKLCISSVLDKNVHIKIGKNYVFITKQLKHVTFTINGGIQRTTYVPLNLLHKANNKYRPLNECIEKERDIPLGIVLRAGEDVIDKASELMEVAKEKLIMLPSYEPAHVYIYEGEAASFGSDFFIFENKPHGLFLRVFGSPFGHQITQQIYEYIKTEGYTQIDDEKIKEALECRGKPVLVGPPQRNPQRDGRVEVEISPDELLAYIKIIPPKFGGLNVDFDCVLNKLRESNVVFGVDEEKIKDILNKKHFNESICIARGRLPTQGSPAKIEYLFPVDIKSKLKLQEDGRIDFRQISVITGVARGQVLVRKIPSSVGSPGMTVTAKMIPPIKGSDLKLPAGRGTVVSDDGLELLAAISGHVYIAKGRVCVDEVCYINSDIDMHTGNIKFPGTVFIKGDVADGFEVNVGGDVYIEGTVGRARIISEGEVVVCKGINHAKITATSLITKYINSASIEVKDAVVVEQEILHSEVYADKVEVVSGKYGAIIGGKIVAQSYVRCKQLGSIGTGSRVEVGVKPSIRRRLENINNLLQEFKPKLYNLNLQLKRSKFQDTQRLKECMKLQKQIEQLERQRALLKQDILLGRRGIVEVINYAFSPSTITIANYTLKLTDFYKHVIFKYRAGQVVILPL